MFWINKKVIFVFVVLVFMFLLASVGFAEDKSLEDELEDWQKDWFVWDNMVDYKYNSENGVWETGDSIIKLGKNRMIMSHKDVFYFYIQDDTKIYTIETNSLDFVMSMNPDNIKSIDGTNIDLTRSKYGGRYVTIEGETITYYYDEDRSEDKMAAQVITFSKGEVQNIDTKEFDLKSGTVITQYGTKMNIITINAKTEEGYTYYSRQVGKKKDETITGTRLIDNHDETFTRKIYSRNGKIKSDIETRAYEEKSFKEDGKEKIVKKTAWIEREHDYDKDDVEVVSRGYRYETESSGRRRITRTYVKTPTGKEIVIKYPRGDEKPECIGDGCGQVEWNGKEERWEGIDDVIERGLAEANKGRIAYNIMTGAKQIQEFGAGGKLFSRWFKGKWWDTWNRAMGYITGLKKEGMSTKYCSKYLSDYKQEGTNVIGPSAMGTLPVTGFVEGTKKIIEALVDCTEDDNCTGFGTAKCVNNFCECEEKGELGNCDKCKIGGICEKNYDVYKLNFKVGAIANDISFNVVLYKKDGTKKSLFKENIPVKKSETATTQSVTESPAIVQQSDTKYSKICLDFTEGFKPKENVCAKIVESEDRIKIPSSSIIKTGTGLAGFLKGSTLFGMIGGGPGDEDDEDEEEEVEAGKKQQPNPI